MRLTHRELEILNSVMGHVQDLEDHLPPAFADTLESDEFNELNERIAEALADTE